MRLSQYIITDGTRFIYRNHSGKFVPVPSEVMADTFSKRQAEAIYNNSLPKALKSVFHVEKYDKPPVQIKQVAKEEMDKNVEKVMISENIQRWLNKVSDLNGVAKEVQKRKEELEKHLHDLENELIDIEHYIEFSNLNAAQGYKASKDIKDCRMKRRSVKNELLVLDIILE